MKVKNILSIVGICLSLSACSTPYQNGEGSITGGYYQNQVTPSLVSIIFSGNGNTDVATVKKFALFRAADYAREQGKPAFLVYGNLLLAAADRPGNEPITGSLGSKPRATVYVRLLDEYRPNAIRTEDVLKEKNSVIPTEQGVVTERGLGR